MSENTEEIRPDGTNVLRLPTQEEVQAHRPKLDPVDQNPAPRLNPGELEEIEARLRAATDGPWTVVHASQGIRGDRPYAWVGPEVEQWDGTCKIAPVVERSNSGTMADIRFIAHARADMEKLINTVNALTGRIARRFNETAEARQDAARARERAEQAEVALKAAQEHDRIKQLIADTYDVPVELLEGPREVTSPSYGWPEREAAMSRQRAEALAALERAEADTKIWQSRADDWRQRAEVAQSRIDRYTQDALERTKVVASLKRQIEELEAELIHQTEQVDVQRRRAEVAEAEVTSLKRQIEGVDRIRQRFGINPEADLYLEIGRVIGNLQTSEAEVAGLKREIESLKQSVQARDRLLVTATEGQGKALRDVEIRETAIKGLEVALEDWRKAGERVASAVFDPATAGALEYESYPPDLEKSWTKLAEVVREVRAAIPRLKPSEGR